MKIMISQPMNGLSVEQVKANRKAVVEKLEKQGHEVVDTVIAETPPDSPHQALWYLGKSLELMAQCDAVCFLPGWGNARGCLIEHEVAEKYGLAVFHYMPELECYVPVANWKAI